MPTAISQQSPIDPCTWGNVESKIHALCGHFLFKQHKGCINGAFAHVITRRAGVVPRAVVVPAPAAAPEPTPDPTVPHAICL